MARTATDILKEAILLERRGKAFYSTVAEKSDSESAKKIFEMMADEEDAHIRFLSEQFKHYENHHEFLSPEGVEEPAEDEVALRVLSDQMKKEINAASFEAAAISAAIDFEDRAVKIYASRAEEAIDPNEKALYQMLAKWEMGHQKMLHELNEELKADIWNDNSFWPF
jgi:rubrerythrin